MKFSNLIIQIQTDFYPVVSLVPFRQNFEAVSPILGQDNKGINLDQ